MRVLFVVFLLAGCSAESQPVERPPTTPTAAVVPAPTPVPVVVPQALPAAFLPYRVTLVRETQFRFGLPSPLALIAAQIAQESGFSETALSRVGAAGLMQIMPATGRWIAEQTGAAADPLNPTWSIRSGVWFDRFLFDRVTYPTDCDKFGAALASYNGGLGWHNKRQDQAGAPSDFWHSVRLINPGITTANQRENQEYPHRIVFQRQPQFRALGGRFIC